MQKSQFIEIKQKIKCSTNLFDDNKSFEKIFFALILPIQNKLRAKFVFFGENRYAILWKHISYPIKLAR